MRRVLAMERFRKKRWNKCAFAQSIISGRVGEAFLLSPPLPIPPNLLGRGKKALAFFFRRTAALFLAGSQ